MWIQEKDVKFGKFTYVFKSSTNTVEAPTDGEKTPVRNRNSSNDYISDSKFTSLEGTSAFWNHMSDGSWVGANIPILEHGYGYVSVISSGVHDGGNYSVSQMTVETDELAKENTDYWKYIVLAEDDDNSFWGSDPWRTGTRGSKYCIGYSASTYQAKDDEGTSSLYGTYTGARFMLKPSDPCPVVTDESGSDYVRLGNKAMIKEVKYKVQNVQATVKVLLDDSEIYRGTGEVGVNTLDFENDFREASLGAHTLTIQTTANNYACAAKWTFTKVEAEIEIAGNPFEVERRPEKVTVLRATSYAPEAVETIKVSNNANDELPVWETYTGPGHVFQNKSKVAEKWALGWKINVDNTSGSSPAQIYKQVGMAVTFDENN